MLVCDAALEKKKKKKGEEDLKKREGCVESVFALTKCKTAACLLGQD